MKTISIVIQIVTVVQLFSGLKDGEKGKIFYILGMTQSFVLEILTCKIIVFDSFNINIFYKKHFYPEYLI